MPAKEVAEICASITFLLYDTVSPDVLLDSKCLLKILETYYEMKDVKPNIDANLLSRLVAPHHRMFDDISRFYEGCPHILDIRGVKPDSLPDFVIDMAWLPAQYGNMRKEFMEKWLPKGQNLDSLTALLVAEGAERKAE